MLSVFNTLNHRHKVINFFVIPGIRVFWYSPLICHHVFLWSSSCKSKPSWHLIVQSQQWKHFLRKFCSKLARTKPERRQLLTLNRGNALVCRLHY